MVRQLYAAPQPRKIRIRRPVANSATIVFINRNFRSLHLDFTPDPGQISVEGQDLIFFFEDGGKIILQGYFNSFVDKAPLVMITSSGTRISGKEFLDRPRENLPSNGGGHVAGALLSRIDKLGLLNSILCYRADERSENPFLPAPANTDPQIE